MDIKNVFSKPKASPRPRAAKARVLAVKPSRESRTRPSDADDWSDSAPARDKEPPTPTDVAANLRLSKTQVGRRPAAPARTLAEASRRARPAPRPSRPPPNYDPIYQKRRRNVGTFRMVIVMVACAAAGSWLGVGLQSIISKTFMPDDVYKNAVAPPPPTTSFKF